MRNEKGKWDGNSQFFSDDLRDGVVARGSDSTPSSSSNPLSMPPGVNWIEHQVSKMDTLAGIAIKYGVEVADIKRMNGLVTDLQMFAHKTLQIPLPGRHPPSPILSNGFSPGDQSSEHTLTRHPHNDILDSLQSLKLKSTPCKVSPHKVSPAMSSLQGYYGLTSSNKKEAAEGMEMAVYKASRGQHTEDNLHLKTSPFYSPPGGKSRSLTNGLLPVNGKLIEETLVTEAGDSGAERSNENSVRRRQKADIDPTSRANDLLLKEDNGSGFSGITGKGWAMRPKSLSRVSLAADTDSNRLNPIPMVEYFTSDVFSGVRKSSSTSNLQDSENGSIWPTSKWTLKPDLQALSTAAITRPIFDGLPKPISGRRKAALD